MGPAGQSEVVVQVGAQVMPIGVDAQVQPREPVGQAPVQSVVDVHARGPMVPLSGGALASPPVPPSPGGPMVPPIAVPRTQR